MRGVILGLLPLMVAATASAQDASDMYILDKTPTSERLLLLDTVAGAPTNTSVLILDVHSVPKTMLLATLEFNCPKGTYAITKKASNAPGWKSPLTSTARGKPQPVPMGTEMAFVANLVCAGKGDLEKSKMVHSTLSDVVHEYWSK